MKELVICLVFSFLVTLVEPAKILIVIPFSAKSHYISQRDIGLELARIGHEVHVITSNLEAEALPNYHQHHVESLDFWKVLPDFSIPPNPFDYKKEPQYKTISMLSMVNLRLTEHALNSSSVQQLFDKEKHFDVVICEVFFQEAFYALSHKYDAPLILVTTFGNHLRTNFYSRNPLQLTTNMHEYMNTNIPPSFVDRLKNMFNLAYELLLYKYNFMPAQESLARKYIKGLKEPVPCLEQLSSQAALVLMNSHFSTHTPTAYLPNFIQVGGLNIKPSDKKLPEDLQKILDDAMDGVIYMSLGSNVKMSHMSEDKRNAFLKAFANVKQKVLWKWEEEDLPNLPNNVVTKKWFPQNEILEHENVKLFISHGGLIGMQESLYNGIPILGLPVYSDQFNNLLRATIEGFAEMLDYEQLNEDAVAEKLQKILSNDNYMKKAKEVSMRFKDRPMSGLDTAIWWIEYVIRHRGADFMKTPALNMSFLEYHNLDVLLLVVTVVLVVLYGVFWIANLVTRVFANSPRNKPKSKKS